MCTAPVFNTVHGIRLSAMPRELCCKCREVKDVRLCADDLLCKDCDADNERQLAAIRASNTGGKLSSAVGSRQTTECLPKSRGAQVAVSLPSVSESRSTTMISTNPTTTPSVHSSVTHDADTVLPVNTAATSSDKSFGPSIAAASCSAVVISELLSYLQFYRSKSTPDNLHKTIVHFFLPSEIAEAKRKVVSLFETYLIDCPFKVVRRQSQLRSAHDAETEDIIAIFTTLDNLDVLKSYLFVAANFDRLPKYGPEELNICSIADRQSRLDYDVQTLAHSVEDARISANIGNQLEGCMVTLQGHMDKLSAACDKVLAVAATTRPSLAAADVNSSRRSTGSSTMERADAPAVKSDTRRNVIVSGVAENRNPAEWSKTVANALGIAAGREVSFDDAFRLGKYSPDKPPRPILVKMHVPWDKRLVIIGARRLRDHPEFRRIYLRDDLPLADRRRDTLERLKHKAERENRNVAVSEDGVLSIDGIACFSLQSGFINNVSDGGN